MATRRPIIKLEDALICYKNFSGKETDCNAKGRRNFNLILPEELALQLEEDGWNIKKDPPREEGDSPRYRTEVNVNFECDYPPRIYAYNEDNMHKRMVLDENSVSRLDGLFVVKCDVIVSGRLWEDKKSHTTRVKGYLQEMRAIVRDESGFSSKYSEYDDDDFEENDVF